MIPQYLKEAAWEAIRSTRKTGKVSPNIIEKETAYWDRFPDTVVTESLRRYLNGKYAQKGLNEKYLRGILRGVSKEKAAPINIQKGRASVSISEQLNDQAEALQEWLAT